jgi:hypothetical protein
MIPVKRNKSSASEADMYRCFGRMKSLRSLFLILDCSNWRVTRDSGYKPRFDEGDQKPLDLFRSFRVVLKRGELKETSINCAVDEALARSIWDTIGHNKNGRRLERLKLWPTGGGIYGARTGPDGHVQVIVGNLARSWLFERVPHDDKEDFTARELGQMEGKPTIKTSSNPNPRATTIPTPRFGEYSVLFGPPKKVARIGEMTGRAFLSSRYGNIFILVNNKTNCCILKD